jgi:hypothetical protein
VAALLAGESALDERTGAGEVCPGNDASAFLDPAAQAFRRFPAHDPGHTAARFGVRIPSSRACGAGGAIVTLNPTIEGDRASTTCEIAAGGVRAPSRTVRYPQKRELKADAVQRQGMLLIGEAGERHPAGRFIRLEEPQKVNRDGPNDL